MRITAGYYGLLFSSGGLLALGFIALQYLKHRPSDRVGEPPWPRFIPIEENGRDNAISSIIFTVIVGVPIATWFLFFIRYLDSRVAAWTVEDIAGALGGGFLSSRWAIFSQSCSGEPCWRIHPPNGHGYIAWLTDPLAFLLTLAALTLWALWGKRVFQDRAEIVRRQRQP